jgi:hypothetical protein
MSKSVTLATWSLGLLSIGLAACTSERDVISTDCQSGESTYPSAALHRTLSVERLHLFAGDTIQDVGFGRIQDIAVDPTGRVYVLDSMIRRVSVHDPEGRTLLVFGREGEGPGEFEYPTRLFLAPPDTIKVFDASLFRVTSFSSSGAALATISPPAESRFGQDPEIRFGPGGELYKLGFEGYQESLISALDGVKGVIRGRNTIEKWTPPRTDWQKLTDVPGLEVYVDLGQSVILDVPFAKRPLWAPSREGFWHADNSRYELTSYTSEGAEVCRIQVAWERLRTSNEEREEYYAAEDLADDSRFSQRDVARTREDRKDIPFPNYKPAISSFLVAQDGDLWINPVGDSSATSRTSWHVLAPTGRAKGVANLPARFRPFYIVDDRIYGRELDELDVNRVAVYRVTVPAT